MFCINCENENEIEIKKEIETYSVKGEEITIEAQVSYCKTCGNKVWNDKLDDENIIRAYAEYRSKNGLLQPNEIKAIREKYNMSQVAFARVLGMGDKTITRYENGSLQDVSQNCLIELVSAPENFERLLNKNSGLISVLDCQKAKEALNNLRPIIIYRTSKCIYPFSTSGVNITMTCDDRFWGGLKYAN